MKKLGHYLIEALEAQGVRHVFGIPGVHNLELYRGLAGLDPAALGIPTERDYVARYAERIGRGPIADWDYYLAYNFFRMAAIVQGIRKRAQLGTAASQDAKEFGSGVETLARMGWALAERLGA